eukprot:4590710-Prymnesium_polylepis.1
MPLSGYRFNCLAFATLGSRSLIDPSGTVPCGSTGGFRLRTKANPRGVDGRAAARTPRQFVLQ